MGPEWVAILALIALFVIGTILPINMGALAYVAAWLVGMYSLHLDEKEILAGISADLVLTLIGVTYLFAIARNNGTVDLIVRSAVKAVGGRVALIPWVMFAVTAVLTGIGAASPAACAIVGPIALGLRRPLQDQPADDGHDGRPRRPGRRLLADQHLRHHHQLGDGARTDCPPARSPSSSPASWSTCSWRSVLFLVLGGRELMKRRIDPQRDGHPSTRTCTAAARSVPGARHGHVGR